MSADVNDESLAPEIIRTEPAIAAEPYPLRTIVDSRRPGHPPSRMRRALAIAGSVGVIASVAALRMYTPSFTRRTPVPPPARRADDTQPFRIVPTPVPVVCPPPAVPPPSQAQEIAPVKTRDDMPTQPIPTPHKNKVARVMLKKVPASSPHRAPAGAVEPSKHGEVRAGALLDPFGQED
jgi:hypothetical protein